MADIGDDIVGDEDSESMIDSSEGMDETQTDTQDGSVTVKDTDAMVDFFTYEQCNRSCEMEFECTDASEEHGGITFECDEYCDVNVPYIACLFPWLPSACQTIYRDYYACVNLLDTCEAYASFYEGMSQTLLDDTVEDTGGYPCATEYQIFRDNCTDAFSNFSDEALDDCEDEALAVLEWTDQLEW